MDKYYLGLDIGTNSCGWAVTNDRYEILRRKGKNLWGVRLFDGAEQANTRRVYRANRRRLERRKLKLAWLREIFKHEIDKLDASMLDRIKYSSLYEEDKLYMNDKLTSKDSLFKGYVDGKSYSDKDYFNDYPTIYHLRQALTKEPALDVRFLYLAVHNIIKRRGHFLYKGEFGENQKLIDCINNCFNYLNGLGSEDIETFALENINEEIENVLIVTIKEVRSIRDSKRVFVEKFNAKSKVEKAIIESFIDGKLDLNAIFLFEEKKARKLEFANENYETTFIEYQDELSDEQIIAVEKIKQVYETIQLKKMLGDNTYICEAMVQAYELHQEQLKMFKKFIKTYYPKYYYDVFRNPQDKMDKKDKEGKKIISNYPLYVKGCIFNGQKRVVDLYSKTADRSQELFYKYVKSILVSQPQVENIDLNEFENRKQEILRLIENGEFLPKQRTKANSLYPNKLYEKELEQILKINEKKFKFLTEVDESGLTNSQKILKILSFRVPYFVGPIGKNQNGESNFTWVDRVASIDYKPWNFDKMTDLDKAEDDFILRMTNKCTYLQDEDVLSKHSILYSKYMVLNELNNLKVNGIKLSISLKQKIFEELFSKQNKVSVNDVRNFLVNENIYDKNQIKEVVFSGIDKQFVSNYSDYVKLIKSDLFGKEFVDSHIDMFEKVIEYQTIISDKDRLEKRIKREYGAILNDAQIKFLKGLTVSGWGRFSRKFLEGLRFTDLSSGTGEVTTIIDELYNTNQNLQEILFNNKYTLGDELGKLKQQKIDNLTYDNVQELYCSPAVKRGVWQTIKIINEIKDVMGGLPSKIFVEVTRHDEEKGEKGRKDSRLDSLKNLYTSKEFKDVVKQSAIELSELLNELNKTDNSKLRSERLYLYFLQLGKCAYSGKPINIEDVFNDNVCDVDHIIPRSIIKDDSINNKVLVYNKYNKDKSDSYPIYQVYPEWVDKQKYFWKLLVNLKLMSETKFDRLTRVSPLKEEEIGAFIERQIVETNQSAKAVIELLKNMVNNPRDIVYSKSKFVSAFRNKYDIFKSRMVNDLHHAKDAYLNIVVGSILNARFTDNPRNFYKSDNVNNRMTKNIDKLFNEIVYSHDGSSVIWDGEKDVEKVKNICFRNDCLVSKMNYANMNGAFYDETVYKSKNNGNVSADIIPRKGDDKLLSNIERYGGYSSLKNAYFMIIESDGKKGKRKKTIESVPILLVRKYKDKENKDELILNWIIDKYELKNPKLILPKLNIQSTLKIGDGEYVLGAKTGEQYVLRNANQWLVDNHITSYVKVIEKYIELKQDKKDSYLKEENGKVVISFARKDGNKEIALTRNDNNKLYDLLVKQTGKKIYKGLAIGNIINSKLSSSFEIFNNLEVMQQAEVLYNIIKSLTTDASCSDMRLLQDSPNVGKIYINKDITDKDIKVIYRSCTGLIQKEVRI